MVARLIAPVGAILGAVISVRHLILPTVGLAAVLVLVARWAVFPALASAVIAPGRPARISSAQ